MGEIPTALFLYIMCGLKKGKRYFKPGILSIVTKLLRLHIASTSFLSFTFLHPCQLPPFRGQFRASLCHKGGSGGGDTTTDHHSTYRTSGNTGSGGFDTQEN